MGLTLSKCAGEKEMRTDFGSKANLSHVSSESEKWIPIDCNG